MVKICRTTTWQAMNRNRRKMTPTRWMNCSVNWRLTVLVCTCTPTVDCNILVQWNWDFTAEMFDEWTCYMCTLELHSFTHDRCPGSAVLVGRLKPTEWLLTGNVLFLMLSQQCASTRVKDLGAILVLSVNEPLSWLPVWQLTLTGELNSGTFLNTSITVRYISWELMMGWLG